MSQDKPASITRCPKRRSDLFERKLGNDLVVMLPGFDQGASLGGSGPVVWELCDGQHTVEAMVQELCVRFDGERETIHSDVVATLSQLEKLGFLD